MCWVGENIKKVAEEDVKCQKIVDHHIPSDTYHAYFHEFFEYECGKVYEEKITPEITNSSNDHEFIRINEGFHCYSMDIAMKRLASRSIELTSMTHGTRSAYPSHVNPAFNTVVMECTIPKGTEYYENGSGEIVTSKIIVEEEIQIKDELYEKEFRYLE